MPEKLGEMPMVTTADVVIRDGGPGPPTPRTCPTRRPVALCRTRGWPLDPTEIAHQAAYQPNAQAECAGRLLPVKGHPHGHVVGLVVIH